MPSWCGSENYCRNATAPGRGEAHALRAPTSTPGSRSYFSSGTGWRWSQVATPCPAWASSRDPRPKTVPLVLTESFNELGEDPGIAFHEAPLPGIARHGPGHKPPRSTNSHLAAPRNQLPPATVLSKPAAEIVNPTSPRLLPDSLRAPSPAARQSAGRHSSHPRDVENLVGPCGIRSGFGRGRSLSRKGGASGRLRK